VLPRCLSPFVRPVSIVLALVALGVGPLSAQKREDPGDLATAGRKKYEDRDYGDAARLLSRSLAIPGLDTIRVDESRRLLAASQERFVADWYRHADFYGSKDSKRGNVTITPESELELGRTTAIAVTASSDAEAQAYLQSVANRLMLNGPRGNYPLSVQLYESTDANAVTVPGRMFISAPLLRLIDSEPELMAAVAHELSHLYAHHAARRLIRDQRDQGLMSALSAGFGPLAAGAKAAVSGLAALGAKVGIDLFQKAFNRGEESEADRYATHLLFNAGVPPEALGTLLTKLYQQNARQPIKLLSTHPPLGERLEDLNEYIAAFPGLDARADSTEFKRAIKKQGAPLSPTTTASSPVGVPPSSPPAAGPPPASSLPPVVAPPASSLPPVKRPPGLVFDLHH
jgi:Zn-dependent protease with chaperone function